MDFGRSAPGAEERLKEAKVRARQQNTKSKSTWEEAVEKGEHKRVQQLLEAGQPINEMLKWTRSPAMYIAARNNDGYLLKFLLDNGANPLITTDDDVSAGWISISKGYIDMLVILLSYYPEGHNVDDLVEIARSRRDWRCVWELERFRGVSDENTAVPEQIYELPGGWAMGEVPTGIAGKGPLKNFYWQLGSKNACQDDPPPEAVAMHPLAKYKPYQDYKAIKATGA